jgi:hypothetical protein
VDQVIAIDVDVVIGTADEIAGNAEIWDGVLETLIVEATAHKIVDRITTTAHKIVETTTHKIVELIVTIPKLQPMLIVILVTAATIHVKISVINAETTTTTTTMETLGAAGATREIITQEDITLVDVQELILKKLHLFPK